MSSIEISLSDAKELVYGSDFDEYEVVWQEQVDSRRWVSVNELIIKEVGTGKFYRAYYEQGLTEYQEGCDMFEGDPVTFKECVPYTVEKIEYRNV